MFLLALLSTSPPLMAGGPDWMAGLPDRTPITRITIPGTHNSAALHEPLPSTAACQSLTIPGQLEAGVRFLDLRCRHLNDRFHIFHGPVDQRTSFHDCLTALKTFLKAHPTETVIVSINRAHKTTNATRSFTATFETYLTPGDWWIRNELRTLGEARGKIILLRRFASEKHLGISATNWRSQARHATRQLVIQDLYGPGSVAAKWTAVSAAFNIKEPDKLHLNFTSGYLRNGLGIPNIRAISGPMHRHLTAYLAKAPHRPHGVVILDFATPDLTEAIFRLNFPQPSGANTE
jgi:1-phosphatidylinositol phosphodiesterase